MIGRHSTRRVEPRAAVAALLSFALPGGGQAYNRRWALAIVLIVPVLAVVGFAALVISAGGSSVLSRLLDPRVLIALVVLNVALLGWRLVAIAQAHDERASLLSRTWPSGVTAGLLVVTIAMHAIPTYYAFKAIDTLGSVALEGGGALFDDREGHDVDLGIPSFQPEVDERVTVLLVGVDFAPGRVGHLTDTMLVATVDPESGEGAMVSVPRDLYGVPLGDGRMYNAKLNSLMSTASADRVTYPLGGPATLKAAIGALLDTRIHYFAAIDIEGMRQLIDVMGGVDVVVERPINDPQFLDSVTGQRGFFLSAGAQHLDGRTAMGYMRSRLGQGDSDFTRAARQQQVLAAIARELTAGSLIVTLPGLLDVVKANVATDVPSARLADLAATVERADLGDLDRVVLTPDDGYVSVDAFSNAGYILRPNLDRIADLGRRIFGLSTAELP